MDYVLFTLVFVLILTLWCLAIILWCLAIILWLYKRYADSGEELPDPKEREKS